MSTTTSSISVGGLVSGIDTNSMVDQLVALEQQKVTAVQKKQDQANVHLSALGTLSSMLSTMSTKATSLYKQSSFSMYTSNTTDDTVATITGTGSGIQGSIDVNVKQMATSWKVATSAQSSQNSGLNLAGVLHVSKSAAALAADNSSSTVDVTILAGDTLKDIASKLNAAAGSGVSATVASFGATDNRLMLNGVDQGSTSFSITEDTGGTVLTGLGLTKASSTRTSDFHLIQKTGIPATASTKLSDLYAGIGGTAVSDTDTFTLDWTNDTDTGTETTVDADTILGTPGANAKMSDVTVGQLAAWMGTTMGTTVSMSNSGELVASDSSGNPLDFTLDFDSAPATRSTVKLGGSHDQTSWKNVLQEGKNAFYTLNGMAISSSSNSDSNTLVGATINLVGTSPSTTETSLSLDRDKAGIQQKVQDFLDSYNAIQAYIRDKTKSTVVSKKDANGTTMNSVTPGDLTSDSAVASIASRLRLAVTSQIPGLSAKTNYDSLASVGILSNKDTGALEINEKKFQQALDSDFDGVTRLFANSAWTDNPAATVGGWTNDTKNGTYALSPSTDVFDGKAGRRVGDILFSTTGNSKGMGVTAASTLAGTIHATFARGVAGSLSQYIAEVTSPLSGSIKGDTDTITKQIQAYGTQATTVQDRVDKYRTSLVSQFSAMESAMLKLKNQNSAFLNQISSLQ